MKRRLLAKALMVAIATQSRLFFDISLKKWLMDNMYAVYTLISTVPGLCAKALLTAIRIRLPEGIKIKQWARLSIATR